MGKLREFIEEILEGRGGRRDFNFGKTKGSINRSEILGTTFQMRFDTRSKKGRRIMREFATLFDQIEGMEWTKELEDNSRQWNEKLDLPRACITLEMTRRMRMFIHWNGNRILDHRIKATKRKARCKICDLIIDKSEERVYVCDSSKTRRFISCIPCYGLLRKSLSERELAPKF